MHDLFHKLRPMPNQRTMLVDTQPLKQTEMDLWTVESIQQTAILWVPEDALCVLLIEVWIRHPNELKSSSVNEQVDWLLGWVAIPPFVQVTTHGSTLNPGRFKHCAGDFLTCLAHGPGISPTGRPMLSWKDMLLDRDDVVPPPVMHIRIDKNSQPSIPVPHKIRKPKVHRCIPTP